MKKINTTLLSGLFVLLSFHFAQAQLVEFFERSAGSVTTCCRAIDNMVHVNNLVFYVNDGALWATTEAGTSGRVRDINPTGFDFVKYLTPMGNVLYFSASDGVNGQELWRSDGTAAGTYMVRNINPIAFGGAFPLSLTAINGVLYFSANDGSNGTELWRSDGTSSGTYMIYDINPGTDSAYPYAITGFGGAIYFAATHRDLGTEIWRFNVGPRTLNYFNLGAGSLSTYPGNLMVSSNRLYFTATYPGYGYELYEYNPSNNRFSVFDLNPGNRDAFPSLFVQDGTQFYFAATTEAYGRELVVFNTATNTWQIKDLNPILLLSEPPVAVGSDPQPYGVVNGDLYFTSKVSNTVSILTRDGLLSSATVPFAGRYVSVENPTFIGQSTSRLPVPSVAQEKRLFFKATVGGSQQLAIFNSFGQTYPVGLPGATSALIAHGGLYVGTESGTIHKRLPYFIRATGDEEEDNVAASPAPENQSHTQTASYDVEVPATALFAEVATIQTQTAALPAETNNASTISREWQIVPNPVVATLGARLYGKSTTETDGIVQVINMNGQLLSTQQQRLTVGENVVEINTTNFPVGQYMVRLLRDNSIETVKLTVGGQ